MVKSWGISTRGDNLSPLRTHPHQMPAFHIELSESLAQIFLPLFPNFSPQSHASNQPKTYKGKCTAARAIFKSSA